MYLSSVVAVKQFASLKNKFAQWVDLLPVSVACACALVTKSFQSTSQKMIHQSCLSPSRATASALK
jgi:hypothetical protein